MAQSNKLYQVQDSEYPMFVVATDFDECLQLWRQYVAKEQDEPPLPDLQPDGVMFMCNSDELLAYHPGVVQALNLQLEVVLRQLPRTADGHPLFLGATVHAVHDSGITKNLTVLGFATPGNGVRHPQMLQRLQVAVSGETFRGIQQYHPVQLYHAHEAAVVADADGSWKSNLREAGLS